MTQNLELVAVISMLAILVAFLVWLFRQTPPTIMMLLVLVFAFLPGTLLACGDFLRWCAAV